MLSLNSFNYYYKFIIKNLILRFFIIYFFKKRLYNILILNKFVSANIKLHLLSNKIYKTSF